MDARPGILQRPTFLCSVAMVGQNLSLLGLRRILAWVFQREAQGRSTLPEATGFSLAQTLVISTAFVLVAHVPKKVKVDSPGRRAMVTFVTG